MTMFRKAAKIIGALMVLMGLIWAAQGSGIFPYPAHSFMIDQTPWIYYGLLLTLAGAAVMALARRV